MCTCIGIKHAIEEWVIYNNVRISRRRVVQVRTVTDPFCETHADSTPEPDWTPRTG